MKKIFLKTINWMLNPLGVGFTRLENDYKNKEFSMPLLIKRIAQRMLNIQTVIDIGASDGNWSVCAMEYFAHSKLLAIEPLEERLGSLKTIKRQFENFDYAICAAGAIDGEEAVLNVTSDLDGSTIDGSNPGKPRTIALRTVDSIVMDKNLPGPYFLKFDTHGYEIPILEGSKNVLKNTVAILMETYNFQLTPSSLRFHEICSYMESIGFRPIDLADPLLRAYDKVFWQIDILFIKNDSNVFRYPHYQ